MEISELFGLPAHPLIVHAAVVLVPLAALATVLVAVMPRFRRSYAPIAAALAIMGLGSVALAQGSGEELEHDVAETELVEAHTDIGETLMPWIVVLTITSVGIAGVDIATRRGGSARLAAAPVTIALAVIALVAATGSVWKVVEIGHSGAKAAWTEDVASTDTGSGGAVDGDHDDD